MSLPAVTWSMPLKGVRLLYMHESDTEILIGLETEPKPVACPACGSPSVVGYGKMTWRVRDLPIEKKSVFLEIRRRRLRCRTCQVTFNEPVSHISSNHRATVRLVQSIWKMALQAPFTTLSQSFDMDEKTIRNIFQDSFTLAVAQFMTLPQPPAPAALVIRLTKILRRQRVMWINLDQGTLIAMDEKLVPDSVRDTLRRITGGARVTIQIPADVALIDALHASGTCDLVLHPASFKSACNDLIDYGRTIPAAADYVERLLQLVQAKNAAQASRLWHDLSMPPPGLRSRMRALIAAVALLPPNCFDAFDEPNHACDILVEQLDKILNKDFSRRSYDVICAIVLLDKALQKTARTGVAQDGRHLGYQKANYGTSIAKLVARLEKVRGFASGD